MSDNLKCQEKMFHAWAIHPCGKKAKATKDGPRCSVHSPEAKAKRLAKREGRWAERSREWKEQDAIDKAEKTLIKAAMHHSMQLSEIAKRLRDTVERINAARKKRGVDPIAP